MTCREFLDAYADVRDGSLEDPAVRRAVETHLGECLRCRRLVRTMTRSLALLHDAVDEVEPSAGFRAGLRARLHAEVAIGSPVSPTHAGVAAAVLVAAALGLIVIESVARGAGVEQARGAPAPFEAAISNVTLPAFSRSTLEFHGIQAPLGTHVLFSR